ncbi:hypothetical protein [uncultured Eubacterium sp.]|uniref:hypothetical protein n=1 Tax=uncultured Eubacterium sp. TaxID=165185 RepID=UPI0025E65BB9|nr:hypothetical protein [uncultured Eubacterium sp.]MCI6537554.1 hypothetical protein [Lachnospiraceae bacterium]
MAGFIIWIVVLFFIISSVRKGKKSSNRSAQPPVHTQKSERTERPQPQKTFSQQRSYQSQPQKTSGQQRSYQLQTGSKSRQTAGGAKSYGSSRTGSAANVTESKKEKTEAQKQREADLQAAFDKNQIVAAAKANTREVERDNDRDAEAEHLMDAVYDAMIKGPQNTMEFQRDFIAEGMDMLNSFDL